MQVQMPTEGREGNDGNAVVIEGVRLAVLEFLGLQVVLVVQAVMPDCWRRVS